MNALLCAVARRSHERSAPVRALHNRGLNSWRPPARQTPHIRAHSRCFAVLYKVCFGTLDAGYPSAADALLGDSGETHQSWSEKRAALRTATQCSAPRHAGISWNLAASGRSGCCVLRRPQALGLSGSTGAFFEIEPYKITLANPYRER
jgi:hypothetical protein